MPVDPEWTILFVYWLLVGSYLGVGLLFVGAVWWLAHVLRRRRLFAHAAAWRTLICFEPPGPVEPERLDSVAAMVESLRPAQPEELATLEEAQRPATASPSGV